MNRQGENAVPRNPKSLYHPARVTWSLMPHGARPTKMGSRSERGDELQHLHQRIEELQSALGESRHAEATLRTLIDGAPTALAWLDADGKVLFANRGLYERPLADCLGKPITEFLPEHERAPLDEALRRAAEGRSVLHDASCAPRRGRSQVFEHCIGRVEEGDQLTGFIVTSREVTEQRRIERHMAHGHRMDALGRFADGLAEEFAELVLSLSTHADLAMEGLSFEDPRRDHLARLQETSRRAAEMARRLRAIGASRSARVELLEVNEVVERFVGLVRRAMPQDVDLDFIPGHQLASIAADPALLDQVLLNLCINARDALPRGGRITIETENVLVNGKYRESHPWATPGRYVLLTVADDGVGMPEEVRDRAFEPFFTTKAPLNGAGLGLAIVYAIVQLHRGMVHLYSEIGHGTTLRVYLPAASRRADVVGSKIAGAVMGGNEVILVAEDQEDLRRLVSKLLERAGYGVLVASDGAEAVELFSRHREQIALVLLDVAMPNLGGREAAERIRSMDPNARILFASGSTERLLSTGGEISPLLEKPYEPDLLLRTVRRILDDGQR
jgi:two-component system cell cycle sensor histidine kinase/response regulator CckA